MSTKAFKYFHSGDGYSKVLYFVEDIVSPFAKPGCDELWVINKKIRITVEVYEE